MPSYRPDRVSEIIRQELSRILRDEVKNPQIPVEKCSILSVEASRDLTHAKVKVSVYAGAEESRAVIKALKNAEGFFRRELAQVLTTRVTPELSFELDTSLEYAQHMQELMNSLREEKHED